ncbi:MAG: HD domain-containing protein [Saprospiraceae bacterium]|nr:HD domain-containing protein [Saprospiraceae bacterium]
MTNQILEQAEALVTEKLSNELPPEVLYHNLLHTQRVVKKTKYLASKEQCTENETLLLALAAWFHDTGFVQQSEGHEEISADFAETFLTDKALSKESIQTIKALILSTRMNGNPPDNKLQKILKDADCSHLASEEFMDISNLLRKERNALGYPKMKLKEWLSGNVTFLKHHHYYTHTAQQEWEAQKQQNIKLVEHNLEQIELGTKKKSRKLGRGIETLFRVQLKNHIELSAIADTKANILLSVNAIIISVALSSLMPKLDSLSNSFLVIPTLILMLASVVCIILSVLSTRPNISKVSVITREMIKNNKTNILFFGNFYRMSLEDFEWGIDYLIDNEDTLYNSLTKDLYFLGLVLERKYRLLRITYNVFMVGIVVSALAFVISFFMTANVA